MSDNSAQETKDSSHAHPENLVVSIHPRSIQRLGNQGGNFEGPVGSDRLPLSLRDERLYGQVPNMLDFGSMLLRVVENRNCVLGPDRQLHLLRSLGVLQVWVSAQGLEATMPVVLRGLLVRANLDFSHIPIEYICEGHAGEVGIDGRPFVLQAGVASQGRVTYCVVRGRPSVVFFLGKTDAQGLTQASVGFRSICGDGCITSNHPMANVDRRSGDLVLLITLESLVTGEIFAQRKISIQVKSSDAEMHPFRVERQRSTPHLFLSAVVNPMAGSPMVNLDQSLRDVVASAVQLGISQEVFVNRARGLFLELNGTTYTLEHATRARI